MVNRYPLTTVDGAEGAPAWKTMLSGHKSGQQFLARFSVGNILPPKRTHIYVAPG